MSIVNCTGLGSVSWLMADSTTNASLYEFIATGRDTYTLIHAIHPSMIFLCYLPIFSITVSYLIYALHTVENLVQPQHKSFAETITKWVEQFLYTAFVVYMVMLLSVWESPFETTLASLSRQTVQWFPQIANGTDIFSVMITGIWWGDTWENSAIDAYSGYGALAFTIYIFWRTRTYPWIMVTKLGVWFRLGMVVFAFCFQILPMLHWQITDCVPLFPTVYEIFAGKPTLF